MFLNKIKTLFCRHEEWNYNNMVSKRTCKKCGRIEYKYIIHSSDKFKKNEIKWKKF